METPRDHNCLPITINLLHGEGFKNINPCTSMEVYVKAQLVNNDKKKTTTTIQKTRIDKRNGSNPIWNSEMKFSLNHNKFLEEQGSEAYNLVFEVKASSGVFGNRKLGEVRLAVKNLYERVAAEDMVVGWTSIRCPVVGGSGKYKGAVYLSYRFGIYEELAAVQYGGAAMAAASAPPLPPIWV